MFSVIREVKINTAEYLFYFLPIVTGELFAAENRGVVTLIIHQHYWWQHNCCNPFQGSLRLGSKSHINIYT